MPSDAENRTTADGHFKWVRDGEPHIQYLRARGWRRIGIETRFDGSRWWLMAYMGTENAVELFPHPLDEVALEDQK